MAFAELYEVIENMNLPYEPYELVEILPRVAQSEDSHMRDDETWNMYKLRLMQLAYWQYSEQGWTLGSVLANPEAFAEEFERIWPEIRGREQDDEDIITVEMEDDDDTIAIEPEPQDPHGIEVLENGKKVIYIS